MARRRTADVSQSQSSLKARPRGTSPGLTVTRDCEGLVATSPAPTGGRSAFWPGLLLFLGVASVFLPTLRHDFITYDDPAYVLHNPHVNTGLTWENLRWAWQSFEHSNWHPLTWMSHQLDCTLFGLQPWGHHLTNLLLHAAGTLVLFLVLHRATGLRWRSLIVAALFGLHPLRVESVAWIAERKDVLSTLCWMLSLWAYVLYGQLRRGADRRRAGLAYAGALGALAAGLTAKPMLVTLPCVLLLLDLWPLDRWRGAPLRQRLGLLAEKLPFFALAAASCIVTTRAQAAGGALQALEDFSLPQRGANALLAYAQYLGKLFWPDRLAVLYPNCGEPLTFWPPVLSAALLLALTGAALFALRHGRAWAAVGWCWFVGTLVPVIGLVQVGGATMADRYSYVPSVGVLLCLVWTVAESSKRWPHRPVLLGATAMAGLLACVGLTSRQLRHWRDSVTLFRHTLAVTQDNWMAHYNLSLAYGRSPATADAAREELRQTITIIADFAERHNQRGLALLQTPGQVPAALAAFEKALRIKGDHLPARLNFGRALLQTPGRAADAVTAFRTILAQAPDHRDAKLLLGLALAQLPGRLDEAIFELRLVVWRWPDDAAAHRALADTLAQAPGRQTEALTEYATALHLDPADAAARAGRDRLRAGQP